jgi:hypothetical protein
MIKTLVALTLGIWMAASTGHADSKVVYNLDLGPNDVVKGTITFPDYGQIPSNEVCVSEDQKTLHAVAPARTRQVCVNPSIDHSDSTRPHTVCERIDRIPEPARNLETLLTVTLNGCVVSHVDRSNSTRPVTICDQYGPVQVSQSLTYEVHSFYPWDYRHENPSITKYRIETCRQ